MYINALHYLVLFCAELAVRQHLDVRKGRNKNKQRNRQTSEQFLAVLVDLFVYVSVTKTPGTEKMLMTWAQMDRFMFVCIHYKQTNIENLLIPQCS